MPAATAAPSRLRSVELTFTLSRSESYAPLLPIPPPQGVLATLPPLPPLPHPGILAFFRCSPPRGGLTLSHPFSEAARASHSRRRVAHPFPLASETGASLLLAVLLPLPPPPPRHSALASDLPPYPPFLPPVRWRARPLFRSSWIADHRSSSRPPPSLSPSLFPPAPSRSLSTPGAATLARPFLVQFCSCIRTSATRARWISLPPQICRVAAGTSPTARKEGGPARRDAKGAAARGGPQREADGSATAGGERCVATTALWTHSTDAHRREGTKGASGCGQFFSFYF